MTTITITRHLARELRAVFRRNLPGHTPRGPTPPLALRAEGGELRAHHRHGHLAVEHVTPYPPGSAAVLMLPLRALADSEGRDDSPVTLESSDPGRIVTRWIDRGIPRMRVDPVEPDRPEGEPLPVPAAWREMPADLLDSLAEAGRIAGEPSRYALDCLQLAGSSGRIVASDGRQLLVRSGLDLPWDGDLLIPASPIFGCANLPRDCPLLLGRTEGHVVLRAGPWTIWSAIRTGVRYPDIDQVLPGDAEAATRLRLDPDDRRFLATALDRLPGADEECRPVTLDCNSRVVVRAKGTDDPHVTELVLDRSAAEGPPVRVCTDRRFLARAARLGCMSLAINRPDRPLACRDRHLLYVWQPLDAEGAIGHPVEGAIRVEASGRARRPPRPSAPAKVAVIPPHPQPVIDPSTSRNTMREPNNPTERQVPAGSPHPVTIDPAALIAEAERIHATLGEAKVGLARLIAGLRRHRKRSRLVAETLATLRKLKLAEAVE